MSGGAASPRSNPAPIVLFVYDRPSHAARVLSALQASPLAGASALTVYSDGPKGSEDRDRVREVRALLRDVGGFASVEVVERPTNQGLARSIIEGVTAGIERHGRVIVVEDDVVTAPSFLEFMNRALDRYQEERGVWHVSGWTPPIDPTDLAPTFFWRMMNCWGWATWADRWSHFRRDPEQLARYLGRGRRRRFNLDGTCDVYRQLTLNRRGRLDTWAIYWYGTIFQQDGLCLAPTRSLVQNIGFDGTGVHRVRSKPDPAPDTATEPLAFPETVREDEAVVARIKAYYLAQRRGRWLRALRSIPSRLRDAWPAPERRSRASPVDP